MSLAITALGGEGFMETEHDPLTLCTSGWEVDRSLDGVVVPERD